MWKVIRPPRTPSVAWYEWCRLERTTTLLLIHGLGDCVHVWNETAKALPKGSTVLGVDLTGHGNADGIPGETTAQMADAVAVDLGRMCSGPILIVGHSMGGDVALHLAGRYGAQVAGLILVDFCGQIDRVAHDMISEGLIRRQEGFEGPESYADWMAGRLAFAERAHLLSYARASLKRCVNGPDILKPFAPCFHLGTLETNRYLDPKNGTALVVPGFEDRMRQLTVPVRLLRAVASGVVSQDAARAGAALAGTEYVSVPMAGHAVPLDNPSVLARQLSLALQEWVRS